MTFALLRSKPFQLFLALIFGSTQALQAASFYTQLANEFPSAYLTAPEPEQPVTRQSEQSNTGAHGYTQPARPDFSVKPLPIEQQRAILLKLLAHNDTAIPNFILDAEARKDLELYTQANLHQRISKTETVCGEVVLAKLLSEPLTQVSAIAARQHVIKCIAHDKKLSADLTRLLQQIKKAEPIVLNYWQAPDPVKQVTLDQFYMESWAQRLNKNINKNSGVLGAKDLLVNALLVFSFIKEPFVHLLHRFIASRTIGLVVKAAKKNENVGKRDDGTYNPFIDPFLNTETSQLTLKNIADAPKHMLTNQYDQCNWFLQDVMGVYPMLSKAAATTLVAASIGFLIYSKKTIVDSIKVKNNVTSYMQTQLIELASCVDALEKMNTLIAHHNFSQFPAIRSLCTKTQSPQLQRLMALLKTNTFKGQPSFFSLVGRILVANKLMEEVKDELRDALEEMGTFDAFLSMAQLVNNSEQQRVQFCFVDLVQSDRPYLKLSSFWNPLVHPDVAIPNDVELGNHVRTMILTGPNTGGKSTAIKGITLNILLAQTFGIAAAQSMAITPFSSLVTNINISDNVKENLSLFAAETNRAKYILETLTNCSRNNTFGFCVFDETFRGTAPDQAEKLSCWYTEELAQLPGVLCLNATHYPTMTKLEEKTGGVCKNYKVEIEKLADGTLKRDYVLKEGFTLQNVAEDILKEQGLMK